MRATTANRDNGGAALGTVGKCHRARTDAGCAYPPRLGEKASRFGYTIDMETQATVSGLDLICETLGVSLETLAERAEIAPEDLYMARDARWTPRTLARLSEHLGVSPDFFAIPIEHLTELLKAFSVVEPSHRLTLVNKIWNIDTVLYAVLENRIFLTLSPPQESFPFRDVLEKFHKHIETGHRSFVAFVRQRLDDEDVMVFSHPFGNSDHSAILFVPHRRNRELRYLIPNEGIIEFKYLVVNENEWLSPLTNALFQWYEVLRVLSRLDNTDDEDGFSLDSAAPWSAIYLEPTVDGYCPRLNEQLREHHTLIKYYMGDTLSPNQYRWCSILIALMEGLPPAVVAECLSHILEIDGEESVDEILRSLNQPILIDKIVEQIVRQRMIPTIYDWVIPSYPSFIKHLAVDEVIRQRVPQHVIQSVLSTSELEYNTLLKKVERLGSTKR